MTSRGFVQDGKVILESPQGFVDGSEVQVVLLAAPRAQAEALDDARRFVEAARKVPASGPTLLERLSDVVGVADGLPSDLAAQHDHYLHGVPKR